MSKTFAIWAACVGLSAAALGAAGPARIPLHDNWLLQSSWQMKADGDAIYACVRASAVNQDL